jgi:hypothetical protein
VGIPDLEPIGKRAVLVEWQTFPDQAVDLRFAKRLAGELKALGVQLDDDLFFICFRGAGAWLRPRRWRQRVTAPAITSLAVSKDRSTTRGIAATSEDGRRRVFPGIRASGTHLSEACSAISLSAYGTNRTFSRSRRQVWFGPTIGLGTTDSVFTASEPKRTTARADSNSVRLSRGRARWRASRSGARSPLLPRL